VKTSFNGNAFAAIIINHIKRAEFPTVFKLIMHEIHRANLIAFLLAPLTAQVCYASIAA